MAVEIKKQLEVLGKILECCKEPKAMHDLIEEIDSYYTKMIPYLAYLEEHELIESLENEKTYKTQVRTTDKGILALYYWRQFLEHIR